MEHLKILLPTDGSELAERAVAYGAAVARFVGADLHLCYAIDYVAAPPVLAASKAHDAPDLLRIDGQHAIDSAIRIVQASDSTYHSHMLEGEPSTALLECARRIEADVIVLATHGRSGLSRAVLGSTAEAILRHSSIPVIAISPNFHGLRGEPLKRIVVAVDGSAPSRKAAEAAYMLASRRGAQVDLCYVIDPVSVTPGMHDDAVALGTALLEGEAVLAARCNVATAKHVVVIEGPTIASRLLDFATTHNADLIVIGTHGRSGIERLIYGSVAEAVLRASSVPVLVMRGASGLSLQ